jgi:hypothetical protein
MGTLVVLIMIYLVPDYKAVMAAGAVAAKEGRPQLLLMAAAAAAVAGAAAAVGTIKTAVLAEVPIDRLL